MAARLREEIEQIVQAGIEAPSAQNRQPWKYLVYMGESKKQLLDVMEQGLIRERDVRQLLPDSQQGLSDAFHTLGIMREAPVIIVVLNQNGTSPYREVDADCRVTEICDSLSIGASIQNMLLRATSLGLGTLWIANTCFAYEELTDFIGTDSWWVQFTVSAIGWCRRYLLSSLLEVCIGEKRKRKREKRKNVR